jgi:hypothetical protein
VVLLLHKIRCLLANLSVKIAQETVKVLEHFNTIGGEEVINIGKLLFIAFTFIENL